MALITIQCWLPNPNKMCVENKKSSFIGNCLFSLVSQACSCTFFFFLAEAVLIAHFLNDPLHSSVLSGQFPHCLFTDCS